MTASNCAGNPRKDKAGMLGKSGSEATAAVPSGALLPSADLATPCLQAHEDIKKRERLTGLTGDSKGLAL